MLFKNYLPTATASKVEDEENNEAIATKKKPEKSAPSRINYHSSPINHQSSPIAIVGKEGVGKHTLVEEAVWRYANQSGVATDYNHRCRVWHLNPNQVVAGMSIVGEWERRLEAILKYVQAPKGRENFPDKILIDNPVALLRIGKTSQTDLTLSRVLKPWLEKRQVQLILLATPEEWKIVQETDRGFADLFQVMRLQEPDLPTAIRIVLHNRRSLELENECSISVPAINQLFTIHRNYLKNKALPGSVMKMLAQITAKYRQGKVDAPEVRAEFKATTGMEERIFDENAVLEKDEIRQALETELVGQPAAVAALADTVHLVKAKLTDRNRPLGSFLFIGSTGTGKTHAAKLLCKILLGGDDHSEGSGRTLLRFDMNEYIDAGALHRLIGDPHNPEGQLTGKVRYRPFSVILLDEIEKAHPKIHDLLLQMLDDARLTDSLGRTVDFSNTIIIMTSNLGAREAANRLGFKIGERDDSSVFRKAVENFFRPELVNRIERIVVFNPLTFNEVQKIAQLQIRELLQREGFVRRTTIVNVSPEALDWVARRGFDAKMGGRALKRQIERDLTLLSAEQLLETPPGTPVIFDILLDDNQLRPRITPLEFVKPNPETWLPELPDEPSAGRFIGRLLHDVEIIELRISNFEQRKGKASHWQQAEKAEWEHFHFKNQVAEIKERQQFLKLRHRDRRHFPALPLRMKRTAIFPRQPNSYRAELATFRDKMFQREALEEIRESYRNLTPSFDSLSSELLVSYLDVALLKAALEGFLSEKKDRLMLVFESCVSNAGQKEVEWAVQRYRHFFEKMDFAHKVDGHKIEVEGYGLLKILEGEEGIHLFYQPHQTPLPVRLSLLAEGKPSQKHQVVRLIDNLETLTDLRTGYSNVAQVSSDEFKLLIFGGMQGSSQRQD